ncbi:hypothetical protein ACIBAG_11760 [Streptomyces sp. NPDC051243]|uniref:hypothetical protein n=1 Tax=Streptomyces sp. NPDC051243 TaxID=3365646 RepID=UPI0037A01A08
MGERAPLGGTAVRHCPDPRATVLILRLPEGRGPRVEATDASPCPQLSTAVDELAESGRGVGIVDAVTGRWGWVALTGRPGRTVWFECDSKVVGQREVNGKRREGDGC